MLPRAEQVVAQLEVSMRAAPPPQVPPSYISGFFQRNRVALVGMVDRLLQAHAAHRERGAVDLPPDLWTAAQRTAANLRAMQLAATKRPQDMTPEDRRVLLQYSGWGGLSIAAVKGKLPEGFPVPEERGLIHEYYTPSLVASEVARVVAPLLPDLRGPDGLVSALEPSAGIGRFVNAASGPVFRDLRWTAVEWSALSARMLRAVRPDVAVFEMPFERWVREHGDKHRGQVRLVLSNPPYGARGASLTEDPDRDYRERRAYAYFLRRGLDLLAEGGLGVFLIPNGFLTGQSVELRRLRERVLRRHHLSSAFRLPSKLFPGAALVVDLLFFRARGGELAEIDPEDQLILDGRYFQEHPDHILGEEVGKVGDDDDQTRPARYGYEVRGTFTRLPDLVERPLCTACTVVRFEPGARAQARGGLARVIDDEIEGLPEDLSHAVLLGTRVDRYLAGLSAGESSLPARLWAELVDVLKAWVARYGNPHLHPGLYKLARSGKTGAERFLAAFQRDGTLIPGLLQKPEIKARYTGRPDDLAALASFLFRARRALTRAELADFYKQQSGRRDLDERLPELLAAGWCLDGERWDELVPAEVYLSGNLWPRHDRAARRAGSDPQAADQLRRLREAIRPAVFDDIDDISPRQGWVPLDLVSEWMSSTLNKGFGAVKLVRKDGIVQVVGRAYDAITEKDNSPLKPEAVWCVGWMNHDKTVFKPKRRADEDLDQVRLKKAREWDQSFRAYVGADPTLRARIEESYNRHMRGFVQPTYSSEPLEIARWDPRGPTLRPHQVAGARRVLANRGGLVAFDVGVGKTYTGIAILAAARQEGWCRRPVVLVPNSIVWKWEADIRRVLPDYRIAVIGSKRKVVSRGERKGMLTSEVDTPQERAHKWTRFQTGEYDVVLLTYTALPRTRMNEESLRAYAAATEAIRREVRLGKRNANRKEEPSERDLAVLREGAGAWVAEHMELPEDMKYDPGITWEDIGIDLILVDEAQNYKNLYLPEPREGGIPRFMGNAGEGSLRAWQLDFRCAAVRKKTGGSGIVLLSATPAKNSPLEFYNLIQYIDHDAWSRAGIVNPEQFIDRYLNIEIRPVVNTAMQIEDRSAVVGFKNLHELRDILFRYGEFRTAEDVGLVLPKPEVEIVQVNMDPEQEAKYQAYVERIEELVTGKDKEGNEIRRTPGAKTAILGLLARLALVAIHNQLDEGMDWKSAQDPRIDPNSPKFDALADRVFTNRACGHIVFVDNLAAHAWVRRVLVARGVPADRIAVLNGETAKSPADRLRIAQAFNGNPEEGVAPAYDVVIANAIAYEGIDLQTRTCAIHHLDLPWEPATLQQRNGRGVRQGNRLSSIAIYYYFARRSQDGLRYNLIAGKLGWMVELLKSQRRDTNNPGAQLELGPEEVLLLISRDPDKTRERLDAIKAARAAEARAKLLEEAVRLVRSANTRLRKAERSADPTEAARLRLEAEERLRDLGKLDPEAWPWARQIPALRERDVLVVGKTGLLLHEGLRLSIPSEWNPEKVEHIELGRIVEDRIAVREAFNTSWSLRNAGDDAFARVRPEHLGGAWPADEEERTLAAIQERLRADRYLWDWKRLGWREAADAWRERVWRRFGSDVVALLARNADYATQPQRVPALVQGRLTVLTGRALGTPGAQVFPPTQEGWRRLLEAARRSDLTFTELDAATRAWWDRPFPRGFLRGDEAEDGAAP